LACALPMSLGNALAQYETPMPVPATTSVPQLHRAAIMRAAVERFHMGLAALDRRNYAEARTHFAAIVALDPPEPQGSTAHYDLAIAQAHLGDLQGAAQSLHLAIDADPGFLAAMANLIAVDLRLGNVRDARTTADRFVSLAPDSARALYSRGLVALQSNDYAVARDDFSKLLRSDPQYAIAHYDLGLAESKLGHYNEAQREFASAVDLAPSYARARFALGTVLLRSGDRNAARAAFDRAARDASDDPSLRDLAIEMRNAIGSP
ncbi:MAG: tetratricopeptide repeat protein, partial [Candidatus Baltobacteraceae bacterium]